MTAPTHRPQPPRSWFALGVVLGLIVAEGCLNPRPEEYPSSADPDSEATGPMLPAFGADCSNSPFADDCEDGAPILEPPAEEGPDFGMGIGPEPGADAGLVDAGSVDAGVPPPDASTNANQ
jgi:hypothetical protein